ncbi:hypothetical protein C0995_012465 [Termitomyces sp. Mi166|nr:hypothetical protein C0995_012465 [Termitomyces sp. Mi166\
MVRRETSRRLTREERSIIRIMSNRGMNADHIAQRHSTTHTSVTNIIRTITGRSDKGGEWDEIGLVFTKDLPSTEAKESSTSQAQPLRSGMSTCALKPIAAKRIWASATSAHPSRSSSTRRGDDEPRSAVLRPLGSPTPPPSEPSMTYAETVRIGFSLCFSMTFMPFVMQLRPLSKGSVEQVETPPDLETFLSNLEHDMSELIVDLEAQGLETIEHLLAFAPWPEERLHKLFKATLPDITIPQRFMLVHGLKNTHGHRLTREERAMIRIMYSRGVVMAHIARHINFGTAAVSNVVKGITGWDDRGDDWDEVSPAFMREFPLREAKESQTKSSESPISAYTRKSATPTTYLQIEDEASFFLLRPARFFTLKPPVPHDSQRLTPMTVVEDHASLPPDLFTFLQNLEHNMSELADDLEAQDLGIIEHLAFAPWSEGRLQEMFKATLQYITVPRRFILVHALSKLKALINAVRRCSCNAEDADAERELTSLIRERDWVVTRSIFETAHRTWKLRGRNPIEMTVAQAPSHRA